MDVITLANSIDLRVKGAVRVQDSFGRSGAAGREDDRRLIGSLDPRKVDSRSADALPKRCDLLQRLAAPELAPTKRHIPRGVGKSPTQQRANRLCFGDADEPIRLRFAQTTHQVFASHPGIDQDRDHAGFHQGKDQFDERGAERNQHRHSHPGTNAPGDQPAGNRVAALIETSERRQRITA